MQQPGDLVAAESCAQGESEFRARLAVPFTQARDALRVLTVPGRGEGVEVERRRGRHDDAASRRRARLVRRRVDLHDPCRVLVRANATGLDEKRPKSPESGAAFVTRIGSSCVRTLALE